MDAIAQLTALGPTLAGVVGDIDPADLDLPTPCSELTVRGVLEHLLTGAAAFTAAFRGEEPTDPDRSDPLGAFGPTLGALVDAVTAPCALDGTIESPFGPMPGEKFARYIALDGLVHGWDLAEATGQPYTPAEELVTAATDFAHQVLDPVRGEGTFGPAQPAPAGASPVDALAAYTGRTVHTPGAATPNRALWEKGDFTRLAESMRRAGAELVDRIGIRAGMRVLDLGCGDGTTAIPEAERGADVFGVDVAANLVAAGRRRAQERGLTTIRFEHGDARDLSWIRDDTFDTTVSVFGAMFAPEPAKVAAEMVRVTRPGGRIVMGNWIPGDPTLVAQILRISSAYSPPPPEGFVSPMTWGVPEQVVERFAAAGVPAAAVTCEPDTFVFETAMSPTDWLGVFRDYYGPTMNAFAAADAAGRADELFAELDALFRAQNRSADPTTTRIPATFLRVSVDV